jgi:hypothetical protein
MDAVSQEALDSLTAVVQSLLPPPNDPVLPPLLAIIPVSVLPVGIGGLVGTNADPLGDILGRQVKAHAVVTAIAKDPKALQSEVGNIAAALLSDRNTLEQSGILHIELGDLGAIGNSPGALGGNPPVQRDMPFEVTYEFLKIPAAAGDKIQETPITVQIS